MPELLGRSWCGELPLSRRRGASERSAAGRHWSSKKSVSRACFRAFLAFLAFLSYPAPKRTISSELSYFSGALLGILYRRGSERLVGAVEQER